MNFSWISYVIEINPDDQLWRIASLLDLNSAIPLFLLLKMIIFCITSNEMRNDKLNIYGIIKKKTNDALEVLYKFSFASVRITRNLRAKKLYSNEQKSPSPISYVILLYYHYCWCAFKSLILVIWQNWKYTSFWSLLRACLFKFRLLIYAMYKVMRRNYLNQTHIDIRAWEKHVLVGILWDISFGIQLIPSLLCVLQAWCCNF